MNEQQRINCTDCDAPDGVGRREFLLAAGGVAATLAGLQLMPSRAMAQAPAAATPAVRAARPAEYLVQELFASLSDEQKRRVVYDWNHGNANNQTPTRKRMYNAPIFAAHNIGAVYTPAQRELNQRILRAIASDDEGYTKLSRNGTFDASQSFERCGAYIFGNPTDNGQFAWVFSGHHLTVRCDAPHRAHARKSSRSARVRIRASSSSCSAKPPPSRASRAVFSSCVTASGSSSRTREYGPDTR